MQTEIWSLGWIVELQKIAERCFCNELIKCAGTVYVMNHLSYPWVMHQQIQWARLSQTLALIPSTTEMKQWGRKEVRREPLVRRQTESPLSDTKFSCSSVPYPVASISGLVWPSETICCLFLYLAIGSWDPLFWVSPLPFSACTMKCIWNWCSWFHLLWGPSPLSCFSFREALSSEPTNVLHLASLHCQAPLTWFEVFFSHACLSISAKWY